MKKFKYIASAVSLVLMSQSYIKASNDQKYDFENKKSYKKFIEPLSNFDRQFQIWAWLVQNSPAEIQLYIINSMDRKTQGEFRLLGKFSKKIIDDLWSHQHVTITGKTLVEKDENFSREKKRQF